MLALTFVVVTILTAGAGRWLFGRWFNHLTLYSLTWGAALFFYGLDLIHYYPITPTAWGYILLAWAQILVGAAVVVAVARRAPDRGREAPTDSAPATGALATAILVLCALSAVALASQWVALFARYGNLFTALIQLANERYRERIAGQVAGDIPYIGAVAFSACALAGVYVARTGRVTWTAISPLVIVALQGITLAGRMGIAMGTTLFVSALLIAAPRRRAAGPRFWRPRTRAGWGLAMVGGGGAVLAGFLAVTLTRGLDIDLPGVDPALERLATRLPVAASLYSNVSAPPVAFSEYLKAGAPRRAWGSYTFAPVRRALRRLGMGEGVPRYEEVYWTPLHSNVGTYLKNAYADFGPAGVVLFPLLLSAVTAGLYLRTRRTGRTGTAVLTTHAFLVVIFSFNYNIMVLGTWLLSLVAGWITGNILDHHEGAVATAAPAEPAEAPAS